VTEINDTSFILVFGVMLATLLILWVMRSDYHKSRIRSQLESTGATNIDISQRLLDFDRGNGRFEVSYLDRDGHPRHANCRIGAGLFSSEMYWTESPQ
jgi:hypothetical protein